MCKVAFVGNPNAGKTSLFNSLTGCHGCVGNWSGVTSSSCGATLCSDSRVNDCYIVDFPGLYKLPSIDFFDKGADDCVDQELFNAVYDPENHGISLFVNVLDAAHLERQLWLTLELIEAKVPMCVVINRCDLLPQHAQALQAKALAKRLGCRVFKLSTRTGWGLRAFKQFLSEQAIASSDHVLSKMLWPAEDPDRGFCVEYPAALLHAANAACPDKPLFFQLGMLEKQAHEGSTPACMLSKPFCDQLLAFPNGVSEWIAVCKNRAIQSLMALAQAEQPSSIAAKTKQVDAWLLHPFYGMSLFFIAMLLVLWLCLALGQYLQACAEPILSFICIDAVAVCLQSIGAWPLLEVVATEGVGRGMVTAASFMPLMATVFFVLNGFEESGAMARAAVILNRFMLRLGLPGDALVALVLGFGCNVPGIATAGRLKQSKDRLVTIMMMPFMSCTARLAIFTLFCQFFFERYAVFALIFLYALGCTVAVLTGFLVKKSMLHATPSTYVLELPHYQIPDGTRCIRLAISKSFRFVKQSLVYIVPACMVLSVLAHVDISGRFVVSNLSEHSVLAHGSQWMMVAFYPMGLKATAWPLVLALCMGFLAKEVVIGTLAMFYSQQAIAEEAMTLGSALLSRLTDAYQAGVSLPSYLLPLSQTPDMLPGLASAFDHAHIAMGYLIFVLLYFPCISTVFAMSKQIGSRFAWISVLWSLVCAYVCSVLYVAVMCASWSQLAWWLICGCVVAFMLRFAYHQRMDYPHIGFSH